MLKFKFSFLFCFSFVDNLTPVGPGTNIHLHTNNKMSEHLEQYLMPTLTLKIIKYLNIVTYHGFIRVYAHHRDLNLFSR